MGHSCCRISCVDDISPPQTECEAQERSGSGDDVAAPGSLDASAEAPAPVVVYERTSLSRDLALSREKCLELGTALASKEAELARAWSEAQRAADIIAAVRGLGWALLQVPAATASTFMLSTDTKVQMTRMMLCCAVLKFRMRQ